MKTISRWDKFLVNYIGIIPNKPEVKAYLKECAENIYKGKLLSIHIRRISSK